MPLTNFTLTPDAGASPSWSNVSNAVGQDGAEASTSTGLAYLQVNYDAASVIPSDATLGAITVTMRVRATSSGGMPNIYLREIGTRGYSDGSPYTVTPTGSLVTYTLLSDTATNIGLTVAQLHAGYLRFRTLLVGGTTATIFVDHITFSVDWTAAAAAIPVLFMGENF